VLLVLTPTNGTTTVYLIRSVQQDRNTFYQMMWCS